MAKFYAFFSKHCTSPGKPGIRILFLVLLAGGISPADGQNLIRNPGADTVPILTNIDPTLIFWKRTGAVTDTFGYDHGIGGDWYLPSANYYFPTGSQSGAYFFCAGSDTN